MNIVFGGALAILGCLSATAVEPVHAWNFEKYEGGHVEDVGRGARPRTLYAKTVDVGRGVGGSIGCWHGKGRTSHVSAYPIESQALTVDLSFCLDEPVNADVGNTLWYYAWQTWRRGRILTRLTNDRRLEVSFCRSASKDGKTPAVDFVAASDPLEILPRRFYAVRVSCGEDGILSAHLDGVLVVRKGGCPGVQGVRTAESPEWYPLFKIGENDDNLSNPTAPLNGVVDNVAIYDVALGEPDTLADGDGVTGVPGDVLVLTGGVGRTSLFTIREKIGDGVNGALLGVKIPVEEKFRKCRSAAQMKVDEEFVRVTVACPVPKGLSVDSNQSSVWKGDAVEIFIRPDMGSGTYYHYAMNAAGLSSGSCYCDGVARSGWKSGLTVTRKTTKNGFSLSASIPRSELFPEMLKEGMSFAAQFIRTGPTTDGVSSWIPVGKSFHDPSTFGKVIYGSTAAYFETGLTQMRESARMLFKTDATQKEAFEALSAAEKTVKEKGGDPRAYLALEGLLRNLDQTYRRLALDGRKLLLYCPDDVWGNRLESSLLTRPLERLSARIPIGGRCCLPFAVANLSDRQYLGQIKVLDRGSRQPFNQQGADSISRRISLGESILLQTSAGKDLWDPVVPFPLGSIIRIPTHGMTVIWVSFDAGELKAGKHQALLELRASYPEFQNEEVPVELEVVDADLSEVKPDRSCYTFLTTVPENRRAMEFLVRGGYNVIYVGTPGRRHLKIYNRYGDDGTLIPGDMSDLDRIVDAHLAAGMQRERVKLWIYLSFEYSNGPGNAGEKMGEKWNVAMKAFLEQLYAHVFEKYGIGSERVVLYPYDEPSGDVDDAKTRMGQAYLMGKTIKSFGSQYRLLVNPLPGIPEEQWRKAIAKFSECYDIIEFYGPGLTPQRVEYAKTFPYREFWTYNIISKETPPAVYRRDYWRNMRDGFRELATYWHLESASADGDGLYAADGKTDYGTIYVDWDNDGIVGSRRQIASDMGFEDVRLILWCQLKAKGKPSLLEQIAAIVRKAADVGTMAAMDEGRAALLSLVGEVSK